MKKMEANNNNDQMSSYANLPADVLELIVEGLSVVDRLHCEGVNRHWRTAMLSQVWPNTRMEKLDRETVFEGTNAGQREKFNAESLVALFRRVKGSVVEADFNSFYNRLANIDAHFGAMIEGCANLRAVTIGESPASEQALKALAKLPNLKELVFWGDNAGFTDAVLKAIARRGQLKKLAIHDHYDGFGERFSECPLTDDAVAFLIQRCQQLVTLCITRCDNITQRSLRAVVAEVNRRHGTPPRSLPNGPIDSGIFYFNCSKTYGMLLNEERDYEENYGPFDEKRRLDEFGPIIGLDRDTRNDIWIPAMGNPWIVLYENWELYNRKLY